MLRPAMKVLHGNPAHEYYILEVKGDEVLLMRTPSDIYNQNSWVQRYEDGRDKPYYPYWAHKSELYIAYESLGGETDCETNQKRVLR